MITESIKYIPITTSDLKVNTILDFDIFIQADNNIVLFHNGNLPFTEKTLNNLLSKVTAIIALQEKQIEQQASLSLEQRLHQIQNYHTRASYSLARLYDRMTLPASANKTKQDDAKKGVDK